MSSAAHLAVENVIREERSRLLASLIRSCGGDFELAEDALQEAVVEALERWDHDLPARPAGWLLTTARRKALDTLRRSSRWESRQADLADLRQSVEDPRAVRGWMGGDS